MQHTVKELFEADLGVILGMAAQGDIDEFLGEIIDNRNAFAAMVQANAQTVADSREPGDTDQTLIGTGMVYGFLWGYKLAEKGRVTAGATAATEDE